MPPRALATATISFGLVSIPVRLFPTTRTGATISFHTLHAECGTRIKQQWLCPKCEKVISRDDTVKGYEFAKDQYVTFTADELKALEEEASRAIEISEFLPATSIDPLFFDGAYYLGPDKGGTKPYRLLAHALRETGRIAISKYAARGKQYLVAIRALDGGLVMQNLHYADEIRSFEEIEVGDADLKKAEIDLAVQLVEQIAADEFRPDQYRDEVKERIEAQIEAKVSGKEITVAPAEKPGAQVIDLMEALQKSLEKKGATPERAASRKGPRRAAKSRTTKTAKRSRAARK